MLCHEVRSVGLRRPAQIGVFKIDIPVIGKKHLCQGSLAGLPWSHDRDNGVLPRHHLQPFCHLSFYHFRHPSKTEVQLRISTNGVYCTTFRRGNQSGLQLFWDKKTGNRGYTFPLFRLIPPLAISIKAEMPSSPPSCPRQPSPSGDTLKRAERQNRCRDCNAKVCSGLGVRDLHSRRCLRHTQSATDSKCRRPESLRRESIISAPSA